MSFCPLSFFFSVLFEEEKKKEEEKRRITTIHHNNNNSSPPLLPLRPLTSLLLATPSLCVLALPFSRLFILFHFLFFLLLPVLPRDGYPPSKNTSIHQQEAISESSEREEGERQASKTLSPPSIIISSWKTNNQRRMKGKKQLPEKEWSKSLHIQETTQRKSFPETCKEEGSKLIQPHSDNTNTAKQWRRKLRSI